MAKATKDLATKGKTEVPAVMDFEEDAGAGFDDVGQDDMQTPFLVCLQKGSPQVDEDNDKAPTLEGAKAGMLMDSVTHELFPGDDGVIIIPCHYKRAFVHWGDMDSGGGFLGEFSPDDPIVGTTTRDDKNKDVLADGSYLADTRTFYVLMVKPDGDLVPMIMAMSSTQIKKSKRWMTMMRTLKVEGKNGRFNPPMFSHAYRVRTMPESNSKGTWRGLDITMEGPITEAAVYQAAKVFHEMAKAGNVKQADPGGASGEDVPF
ncbi:hypothetical protein KAR91_14925 [Candidatus Pacearchaeota archaeon]|nr:hypothetical protein [Candidatus Pacearchaeota archaeon]